MNKQLLLKHISSEQEMMPFYINEYVRSMQVSLKSYTTIYEYLKEFHRFFYWLYDSGIISDTN